MLDDRATRSSCYVPKLILKGFLVLQHREWLLGFMLICDLIISCHDPHADSRNAPRVRMRFLVQCSRLNCSARLGISRLREELQDLDRSEDLRPAASHGSSVNARPESLHRRGDSGAMPPSLNLEKFSGFWDPWFIMPSYIFIVRISREIYWEKYSQIVWPIAQPLRTIYSRTTS